LYTLIRKSPYSLVDSTIGKSDVVHSLPVVNKMDFLANNIKFFLARETFMFHFIEDHFEQLETVWLPARRAYSSERMSVIRDALAFGGLM
jgi:hypothetical protein